MFAHNPNITLTMDILGKNGSLEDAERAIQNDIPLENNWIHTVYKYHSHPNKRDIQADQ